MNIRLNEAVIKATTEIMRDMIQVRSTHNPAVEKSINNTKGVCSEVTTIISFVGDISGAVMLKCSKRVGAKIASRLLGTEVHPDSEDMKDAIGEILNIIIGNYLILVK